MKPRFPTLALATMCLVWDGRIAVRVAPFDSWSWPAAIINPQTGTEELATEDQADMDQPGWDSERPLVPSAAFLRASIWRFSSENREARK